MNSFQEKLTTFASEFQGIKTESEVTMKNLAEKFDQSQEVNKNSFIAWLLEEQKVFESTAEPYIDEIAKTVETAKRNLEELDKIGQMTKKVASMTTSQVLTSKYEESAKSDRTTALWLYGIGTAIFAAGFLLIIFAFGKLKTIGVDWSVVTLKLALVSILVAATSVPITLGSRFMNQFSHFKRTELELRAINPFLEDMKDVKFKDEIKKNFIEKTFANPISGKDSDSSKDDGLKTLAQQVGQIVISRLPGMSSDTKI